MDILVFGATGSTGSLIVDQLKEKRADYGVAVTKQRGGQDLGVTADQVRVASYDDQESLRAAMDDVETIYFVMPVSPKMVPWTKKRDSCRQGRGCEPHSEAVRSEPEKRRDVWPNSRPRRNGSNDCRIRP